MSTAATRHNEAYRPDIDGLRAVAVLAVVAYHARASVLPGGFVGVDVFFVISGFLISGIVFTRLDRGTFSLLDFYRRRVQRIAPAMFVVVLATLAAAYWLLLPRDATGVAKSAAFSVASLANVYFWLYPKNGYFAPDTWHQPLLHLWSLGVEEQFYMIWPLVLMAIGRRWRSRRFLVWTMGVAAASFALGEALFDRAPSFVYYLLPTRAGELLVGAAAAALVLGQRVQLAPAARLIASVGGATAIVASMLFYDDTTIFPGMRAVLPTAGTAALILAGSQSQGGPITRLLASKPLVGIGLISYSIYLWHWPLMAFYRYGYGELSAAAQWGVPAVAMGLGFVSFVLVERPARALNLPRLRTMVLGFAVPATVIAGLALTIIYGPRLGMPVHDSRYLATLRAMSEKTKPAFSSDQVCQKQRLDAGDFADRHCIVGTPDSVEPDVLLWGDSNAAHYVGVLAHAAERGGFSFRNAEIGSCPPVFADPTPFVASRRLRDCRASLRVARPVVERFRVVVIGASWTTYQQASTRFLASVAETVEWLRERGALVVLLGKMPVVPDYDRLCPEKRLTFPFLTCPARQSPLADEVGRVNAALRQFADRTDGVEYFDMTPYLCPHGKCQSHWNDGEPLYFDSSHISLAASWKLGEWIMTSGGMPPALAAIAAAVHHDGASGTE